MTNNNDLNAIERDRSTSTLVATRHGLIPVGGVQADDEVLTHRGWWSDVRNADRAQI